MSPKPIILLAEDEAALGTIVSDVLESRGYEVIHTTNGARVAELYRARKPDLLIFDVMLPGADGFSLARKIRKSDQRVPILFLTAMTMPEDVIRGFDAGGNDYLRKPFDMGELCARVRALLERFPPGPAEASQSAFSIGEYVYHPLLRTLTHRGATRTLASREGEVLMALYSSRNRHVSRTMLLQKVWGDDDFFSSRSLNVYITRLRKYLQHDPMVQIVNNRGFGYQLVC